MRHFNTESTLKLNDIVTVLCYQCFKRNCVIIAVWFHLQF